MQRTHRTHSPPRGPSPSRQNKVILQREYRKKEEKCFSILRDVIKDLTREELRTRQEILRKGSISDGIPWIGANSSLSPTVIGILTTSEIRMQSGAPSPTKSDDTAAGE